MDKEDFYEMLIEFVKATRESTVGETNIFDVILDGLDYSQSDKEQFEEMT